MKYLSGLVATLLVFILSVPPELQAQQKTAHVVSLNQLRATLVTRSSERAEHIQEIQKLLRHDEVRKQVQALADLDKIERALPSLDDDTLSRLAAQSRSVNDHLQAGMPAWGWVIVAGVAVVILVISDYIE